jgi:hypothetical protein
MRPNKLEGLSLKTLSSQVLEFEGKAPTQLEHLSDSSLLGRLLVLPENVRLDWKVIARYKHSSFSALPSATKEKSFITLAPGRNYAGQKVRKIQKFIQKIFFFKTFLVNYTISQQIQVIS